MTIDIPAKPLYEVDEWPRRPCVIGRAGWVVAQQAPGATSLEADVRRRVRQDERAQRGGM